MSKALANVAEHFPRISEDFRRLSKIADDCRGRPEDVSIIHHQFKYNLRDKLDSSEIIDIFTTEDTENTPLESRMWFRMNFTSCIFTGYKSANQKIGIYTVYER